MRETLEALDRTCASLRETNCIAIRKTGVNVRA